MCDAVTAYGARVCVCMFSLYAHVYVHLYRCTAVGPFVCSPVSSFCILLLLARSHASLLPPPTRHPHSMACAPPLHPIAPIHRIPSRTYHRNDRGESVYVMQHTHLRSAASWAGAWAWAWACACARSWTRSCHVHGHVPRHVLVISLPFLHLSPTRLRWLESLSFLRPLYTRPDIVSYDTASTAPPWYPHDGGVPRAPATNAVVRATAERRMCAARV